MQHFLCSKTKTNPLTYLEARKLFGKLDFQLSQLTEWVSWPPFGKKTKPSGYCCCRHWFDENPTNQIRREFDIFSLREELWNRLNYLHSIPPTLNALVKFGPSPPRGKGPVLGSLGKLCYATQLLGAPSIPVVLTPAMVNFVLSKLWFSSTVDEHLRALDNRKVSAGEGRSGILL